MPFAKMDLATRAQTPSRQPDTTRCHRNAN